MMPGPTHQPVSKKIRNPISAKFSDADLEHIDAYLIKCGFESRSSFMRSCVLGAVRNQLKVVNENGF